MGLHAWVKGSACAENAPAVDKPRQHGQLPTEVGRDLNIPTKNAEFSVMVYISS